MNDAPDANHRRAVRFLACAVTVLVLVNFCILVEAQSPPLQSQSDEIAVVEAREEAFRQAQLKYDTSSAGALLADEFVGTWNHGERVNKEQFVSLIGDKADPLEVLEYADLKIRVYGQAAVVWSTIHERALYSGKPDEYRGRRTAMWVKRNGNWQCVTIHTSPFPVKARR